MMGPRHSVRGSDPAFEAWIDLARHASVRDVLVRRGHWSPRMQGDSGNPCPGCGGRDRFAVNVKKNVWLCRASGAGGDAIALVQHLDQCNFLRAVEEVTGAPPPSLAASETREERIARERLAEARAADMALKIRQEEEERARYRERERAAMWNLWQKTRPVVGSPGEDYLRLRGLEPMPRMAVRFLNRTELWNRSRAQGGRVVHAGPALALAIRGPDDRFAGVERIWIDLARPRGKAEVVDPDRGEIIAAKKGRGAKKGGYVLVAASEAPCTRIIAGEGFETVGSVWKALRDAGSQLFVGAEFRATLSIGNLAGKADGHVKHPTLTRTDAAGRLRAVTVASAIPLGDWPLMPIAASVTELILLADGDSEPFATELAMRRAAARYATAYPHLVVRVAVPGVGVDFNDLLLGRVAA